MSYQGSPTKPLHVSIITVDAENSLVLFFCSTNSNHIVVPFVEELWLVKLRVLFALWMMDTSALWMAGRRVGEGETLGETEATVNVKAANHWALYQQQTSRRVQFWKTVVLDLSKSFPLLRFHRSNGKVLRPVAGLPWWLSGKESTCNAGDLGSIPVGICRDYVLESMATQSSILAWRILWTEELGRLQSTGSQRVGYDWIEHACITPVVTLLLRVSSFWTSVISYLNPDSSYVNGLICKCLLFCEKFPITHVILSCIMVSFWQSQELQLLADAVGGECAAALLELCKEGWLHFVSQWSKWSHRWAVTPVGGPTDTPHVRVKVWWIHPLRSPGGCCLCH